MTTATQITIKSTTGATYTMTEVRWEVRDEIEEAVSWGRTFGTVYCNGQSYDWRMS